MNLKAYERAMFKYRLRELLIKDKCSNCGSIDKLELHHDKQFAEILKESLNALKYDYKEMTEDYTKEELINITNMLLGIHISCKHKTLCETCHTILHKKGKLRKQYLTKPKNKIKKPRKKRRQKSDMEMKGVSKFINLFKGIEFDKPYLINNLLAQINYDPKSFKRLWENKTVQKEVVKLELELITVKRKYYLQKKTISLI